MKKIYTAIMLCLAITTLFAQTKSEVKKMPMAENPINKETKLLCYQRTFNSTLTDSIIYKRAIYWYKTTYKSMRIQTDDCVANKKIVGRGECDLLGLKDANDQLKKGRLKYTCTTTIDNGTVTVEITRFNMQNTVFTPIEPWLEKQETDLNYKYYFIFIQDYAKRTLDSYVETVNVKMGQ